MPLATAFDLTLKDVCLTTLSDEFDLAPGTLDPSIGDIAGMEWSEGCEMSTG